MAFVEVENVDAEELEAQNIQENVQGRPEENVGPRPRPAFLLVRTVDDFEGGSTVNLN